MAVTLFDNLRVQQRAIFQEHISQGAPNHTLNDIKIALRDGLICWIEKGREQRNDDDTGNGPIQGKNVQIPGNGFNDTVTAGAVSLAVVGICAPRNIHVMKRRKEPDFSSFSIRP